MVQPVTGLGKGRSQMSGDERDRTDVNLPARRLGELLILLGHKGLSQTQIAKRVGTPTQYVSDVKHGRRPLSELFARRLGEEFKVNFLWLLGVEDSQRVCHFVWREYKFADDRRACCRRSARASTVEDDVL